VRIGKSRALVRAFVGLRSMRICEPPICCVVFRRREGRRGGGRDSQHHKVGTTEAPDLVDTL
jgi:hypothetical protein